MSRSPDRCSSLERGNPETKPRSCGSQPAHESLFNRRLRVLSPAVRTHVLHSSATAEQINLPEALKANMRAARSQPPHIRYPTLIGAFSGARIGELADATTYDVYQEYGI